MNTQRDSRWAVLILAGAVLGRAILLPAAWGQTGPSITQQPASQTILAGASVTLSMGVSGSGPFRYQWQLNGTDLPNVIMTTAAGNRSAIYDGVATDAYGNLFILDSTNNRIRRVDANGTITTAAGGSVNTSGGSTATNASLWQLGGAAVDASGNLYVADELHNVVWKVAAASFNLFSVVGVSAANSGRYQVIVTSPYGSVTSSVAAVTALLPPSIVSQPPSLGVAVGGAATLNVGAAGTEPLNYSWYFNGTNLVASGTNSGLTLGNASLSEGGGYLVVVTNLYGSVTSAVATLTVGVPPAITNQPAGQTNLAGATATLSVGVSGTGPFDFQWQFNGANLPKELVSGIISTVAGNGTFSYSGDGGAATNAGFHNPVDVATDASGNLFIADVANNRVRKVDANGIITTVAGGGTNNPGDGGAATNAFLGAPWGVALDAAGHLFIADATSLRIRKVDLNGVITTVAGNGSAGYSGDGGAATNAGLYTPTGLAVDASGNLFLADQGNNRVRKVDLNGIITTVAGSASHGFPTLPSFSGDGGAATNAGLYYPYRVALDAAGNLFIADSGNHRIRKVDLNGIISTVAGNNSAAYSGDGGAATNASLYNPSDVAVESTGTLLITDQNNNRIRQVDFAGIMTTVAGNGSAGYSGDAGLATNAGLNQPAGLAVDAFGNLLIADYKNGRIRKVSVRGLPTLSLNNVSSRNAGNYQAIITTPYGSVTSAVASVTVLSPPIIIVQPADAVMAVGGTAAFTVGAMGTQPLFYSWLFDATNQVQAGTNSTLSLTNASLDAGGNYMVVVTNPFGSATSRAATLSVGYAPMIGNQPASQTNSPGAKASLSVTASGTAPFTYQWQLNRTNVPNDIISTVAGGGTNNPGDGGAATNAGLGPPYGVALDGSGNLFIADQGYNSIRKVDANGVITTVAGGGTNDPGDGGAATNASLGTPFGVAVDSFANIFISDYNTNRIRKVDVNGVLTTVAGNGSQGYSGDGGAATNASLWYPKGVAVDAAGNLFIADQGNNRVRRVGTNGIITTVAGNGSIGYSGDGGAATNATLFVPVGVAVDASGNLFINDMINELIRKVDANGFITTVAGGGANYPGDGGAATNASLGGFCDGAAVDATGNLFIADATHNRIRKVDLNGVITTVAGNGAYGYSGDGGAATNASLKYPAGVAVDASGNLLIADLANNRIRKVAVSDFPTLSLDNVSAGNSGNYQVIIASPYGSVTSAVATLTVAPLTSQNPVITMSLPLISGNNLLIGFSLTQGTNSSFTLFQTLDLTLPWTTNTSAVLTTNALGGRYQFSVGAPAAVEFYQVRPP